MQRRNVFYLALVLVMIVAVVGKVELQHRRQERETVRAALEQARVAADSCKDALAESQTRFVHLDRRVDSLRSAMTAYQDRETGGVPHEVYEEYLHAFDAYNAAVALWKARADTLQSRERRCRILIERHNALADSIRRIQEE